MRRSEVKLLQVGSVVEFKECSIGIVIKCYMHFNKSYYLIFWNDNNCVEEYSSANFSSPCYLIVRI